MQTLQGFWTGLDGRRRGALIGGLAALAVVALILGRMAATPTQALLFSGLDDVAAGEVVTALETRGVAYEVRGNAIYVPEAERDSLRLALAGEGLPATGTAGYELLDGLSGFGTTSQMFDAALVRAREGELARTITASPMISAARVHLGIGGDRPFAQTAAPTASVTIRTRGGTISAEHAQALRFLVASAVPGLSAGDVSVIDAETGRLIGGQDRVPGAVDGTRRADEIRTNIDRLLTARVGPGNAVVEVTVDVHDASEIVLERQIDPESRVIVATEREERADSSAEGAGADGVTVASNLPAGDAAEDGGEGGAVAEASESREMITYDLSEMQRETERQAGALRRVSVAVLVATPVETAADGTVTPVPRGAEELDAIEALVRSAMGFDEARGDQVTVREMVFADRDIGLAEGEGASAGLGIDLMRMVPVGALLLLALGIMAFVIRPALRRQPEPAALAAPAATAGLPAPVGSVPDPRTADPGALPAPDSDPDSAEAGEQGQTPALTSMSAGSPGEEDPVTRLRRLIAEREDETVEILRSWMEQDEETA